MRPCKTLAEPINITVTPEIPMNYTTCMSRSLLLAFLTMIVHVSTLQAFESWTGFQNGGALTHSGARIPTDWSPSSGITWQVKLAGYGQSSPVVNGKIIYVTSTSGDNKEALYVEAFERTTGKQLWVHQSTNSSPTKNTTYVSRAAPSPTCDAAGVIALFEGGNIVALDRSGQPRWKRDLVADFGTITSRHGLGASLEQDDANVFAWIEREEKPFVVALSKETGKTVWKSSGLGVTSWSSPRLVPVESGQQLVLSGIGKIAGFDPASGKKLWEFTEISGNSTPTPIPLGNGRFLIGATEGRGETADGRAAESNGVIQITKDADGNYAVGFVWRAKKATSSFGSPVAHQGHAYFVNRAGVIYCLDVETGEQKYAERLPGSIWATPLAVGDRVYFFGKSGTTTVIKAGGTFKQLAANDLWLKDADAVADSPGGGFGGPVLYAVAAVESQLVLRRGDILFAVGH